MLLFNKHIKLLSTWMLVLSLSAHFFFFHGMFDFNVICFEEDGTTNIEYSIDGKTCFEHNNESGDNIISFTSVDDTDCRDISFSEPNHNDDQFVVKKINRLNLNVDLICYSLIDISTAKNFDTKLDNKTIANFNPTKQFKTVSLII